MTGKLRHKLNQMGYHSYREYFVKEYDCVDEDDTLRFNAPLMHPGRGPLSPAVKMLIVLTIITFCLIGTIVAMIPFGIIFH